MKRAVILHGTSADAMSGWRPWLKGKLEAEGYTVWVPSLPENDTPAHKVYNDFLLNSDWDFTDNLLIGHSSGAVEVLNLLMDDRCPKVNLAVPVSAWNERLIDETPDATDQFKNLFPVNGFNFEIIKQKTKRIVFVHNEFDPYCSPADAEYLSRQLGAELVMLHASHGDNSDHLGSPMTEFPELWNVIDSSLN